MMLDLAADLPLLAIGIEIAESATRLSLVLAPDPGARRWQARLSAPPAPETAVDQIGALVARALREQGSEAAGDAQTPPVRVGIALWGRVDARHGMVTTLPQAPGWSEFALAARMAERLHAPVRLDAAVNAAALAEAALGAGTGHDPVLYVSLARSVTAAAVVRGLPLHGAHGLEGGLAHVQVRPDGPRCSCGARGHLEPIASAQALVRTLIGRASDVDESLDAIHRVTGGRAESLTAPQVVQLAADGDPTAQKVLNDALDTLAHALAPVAALLDPSVVVIGGPLSAAGAAFLSPLGARLAALLRPAFEPPPIVAGVLEPHPALVGAFLLATLTSGPLHEPA